MSVPTKDEIALAAERYSPQGWRSGHKRPAFIAGVDFALNCVFTRAASCYVERNGKHQWMSGKDEHSDEMECVMCGAKGRIVEVSR